MYVTTVGGLSQQEASQTSNVNPQGLGKQDFLKLLVTQMSHQNPLQPQDGTEFIAQLATFTSLEQLTEVNSKLAAIEQAQAAIISGQTMNLVGKHVTYPGSDIFLDGSASKTTYTLGQKAEVTITIKDMNGRVVREMSTHGQPGENELSWDGLDQNGNPMSSGQYKVEIRAYAENGDEVSVENVSRGLVTGVTFTESGPVLMIGDSRITPSDVRSVETGS